MRVWIATWDYIIVSSVSDRPTGVCFVGSYIVKYALVAAIKRQSGPNIAYYWALRAVRGIRVWNSGVVMCPI